jgi:ribonucleoside-diphosphate reductase beta chain
MIGRPPGADRAARIRHDSVPMRLYHEAKQHGSWDPRRLDLRRDGEDWPRLTVAERDVLLRLTAMFQSAEETMTRDLLPLVLSIVREDRLEEEMFLTTFLAEEAKHTEFFRRVVEEVFGVSGELGRYQTPSFQALFREKVPAAMEALFTDSSPVAQAEAIVTYSLIGEGVLGEAGYHVFAGALDGRGILPGYRAGLRLAQADEDRHMTYASFVLSRLVAAAPDVWDAITRRMDHLLPYTLGVVNEFFQPYEVMPFGLTLESTVEYTIGRFSERWAALEQARERSAGVLGGEEAVQRLVAWMREQAQAPAVDVRLDGAAPIYSFRVEPAGAALLITQEVVDHHTPAEIIAALTAQGVPARLRSGPGQRMTCLRVGGRIVVQAPQG